MAQRLGRPLDVDTCIACGARVRFATCPDGCEDVELDLVEQADVERRAEAAGVLEARLAALRGVAETLAAGGDVAREDARAALRMPVPAPAEPAAVIEAWGCPRCGRVDAPQPCLGVCQRRPVAMVDAAELREAEAREAAARAASARLADVVLLAASVRPRAGHEDETRVALHDRARAALAPG